MSLLHPLMLDVVPGIQQTAARALGHLADQSEDMAAAVVRQDILPQLVRSLSRQNVSTTLHISATLARESTFFKSPPL